MLNTELQTHMRKTKGDLDPEHLRLKVLPESFGKGVVVDFQLSDLEWENRVPQSRAQEFHPSLQEVCPQAPGYRPSPLHSGRQSRQ